MISKSLIPVLALSLMGGSWPGAAQAQNDSTMSQTSRDAMYAEALRGLDLRLTALGLKGIWTFGLNPRAYWDAELEAALVGGRLEAPGVRERVHRAFLDALQDLSQGVEDPATLTSDIKFTRKNFISPEELRSMVEMTRGGGDMILELVAPQFPQFRGLREAIGRLYPIVQRGGWEMLPGADVPLQFGSRHPVLVKIKERLRLLGHRIHIIDENFDEDVLRAVNDIQAQLRFSPDGVISPNARTWRYLQTPAHVRLDQVRADMEKLRWLPRNLEDRHIFVNLAFSSFLLVDRQGGQTMSFRAINGRPARKTPSMRDRITYLVFNPTWTVPPTIFLQDKVEAIRRLADPWAIRDYFARNQYDVFTSDFRSTIDPATIQWDAITSSSVPFYIRQRPSYNNALGVVKFMMTNPYAIYLHDTNERHLFAELGRQRSSGCVRLERPLDLAEYLLRGTDWSRERINNFVVKPGQVVDRETRVNLPSAIPVYLVSQTSSLASDGILRFAEDTYEHNALILERLNRKGR